MRPIDADDLKTKFNKDNFKGFILTKIIDMQPTVDPESLREAADRLKWIPVSERLPDNASHPGALCKRCVVMTKDGVTEGWYNPDRESWFILVWFTTRIREYEIDFVSGDIPRVVKVPLHNEIINAWMPLPEPYDPEDIEKEGKA